MTAAATYWLEPTPLLLASGSAARRELLHAVGLPFDVGPVPVDERAIAAELLESRTAPREIAVALAHAKAEAASRRHPDRLIVAADQTLELDGVLFGKPSDRAAARRQLQRLRGKAHWLHSAAVLRRGEGVLWAGVASARLTMRPFSDEFLDTYLSQAGDAVLTSVGAYQLEAEGLLLFDSVEGDHPTILGLPLLPLLHALRDSGALAA